MLNHPAELVCLLGAFDLEDEEIRCTLDRPNCAVVWVHDEPILLEHPRVTTYHLQTPLQQKTLIKEIAWSCPLKSLKMFVRPGWEEMGCMIEECHAAAALLLSDVADFGVKAYRNARTNWKSNGPFFFYKALHRCCENLPAIICGAGPSLDEARDHLASLGSCACILAAGSAISLLGKSSLKPHLACALDKETPLELLSKLHCDTPFCMQSRLSPDCVEAMRGPKILFPESGPLPWERFWLDQGEPLSCGWTAGTFALQVALEMGCNPIILAGMDLCYRNGRKYALQAEHKQVPMVAAVNRRGTLVETQRDWVASARWIEALALNHPNVQFLTISEEGLVGGSVKSVSWTEAVSLLRKEAPIKMRLQDALSRAQRCCIDPKKNALWDESLARCLAACTDLQLELLWQEPVYEFYLEPLWNIWGPLLRDAVKGQDLELHQMLFFRNVLKRLS